MDIEENTRGRNLPNALLCLDIRSKNFLAATLLATASMLTFTSAASWSQDDFVIEIDDSDDEGFVIEVDESEADSVIEIEEVEDGADEFVIELDNTADDAEEFVIETEDAADDNELIIDVDEEATDEDFVIEMDDATDDSVEDSFFAEEPRREQTLAGATQGSQMPINILDFGFEAMIELAPLLDNDDSIDGFMYSKLAFSAEWKSGSEWEARLAADVDGYSESGGDDIDEAQIGIGETYIRYNGSAMRLTAGYQTVIWGRIDELPPIDRLSSQDQIRFILDDLPDRRQPRPMLRVESFFGENKLDLVYAPTFEEPGLPEEGTIWHPIDRQRGEILGLAGNPDLQNIIRNAEIDDHAPDSDHAVGLRFSRGESSFDYALTVQRGRQSSPYFAYNPLNNTFEAKYPRAWHAGADIGIEKNGVVWRFEAAWISDAPVTSEIDGSYDTVDAFNWAAGVEFFPGDGDTRINLQIVGINLDANNVVDRTDIYNFNGSVEIPFAQNRWRFKTRFFAGLDEKDVYVNPEIAFLGAEPHTFYLATHLFEGSDGTIGGYHEDHSLVTLGWRAEF